VDGLTKEHIIPKALNGTMVLPQSSCIACAKITSKFERTITQEMYGNMRNKRDYKSRHKKNRPQNLLAKYRTSDGAIEQISLDLSDFPDVNLIVDLPLPGIITKSPLTEMNPEFQLRLVGNSNEISKAISLIENKSENKEVSLLLSCTFDWGAFYRLLAKIAHGHLVACVGLEGYIPLLPDLILERSPYLSHYIGGIANGGGWHQMTYHLGLMMIPSPEIGYIAPEIDAGYFSVYIHLFGGMNMPTYQVIAGKITDFDLINLNYIETCNFCLATYLRLPEHRSFSSSGSMDVLVQRRSASSRGFALMASSKASAWAISLLSSS
jgi:hypothetical protein